MLPGTSLRKATKPPFASCKTSWRFAGFCAATVTAKACMQSRRIQNLLLIRGASFDHRELDVISGFELGESIYRRLNRSFNGLRRPAALAIDDLRDSAFF